MSTEAGEAVSESQRRLAIGARCAAHALHYDQNQQSTQAIVLYGRAQKELQAALQGQLTEDERSEAIEALEQVQQRLSHLQSPQPASDAQAAGAEADVAAAATAADAVRPSAPPADEEDSEEAQLLLRITHGVEAYMVPIPDANAASAPEPTPQSAHQQLLPVDVLNVALIGEQAFVFAGDWLYPLQPEVPCLRMRPRFYVFSGESSASSGANQGSYSVAILLKQEVPDAEVQEFERLLDSYSVVFKLTPDAGEEIIELSSAAVAAEEASAVAVVAGQEEDWDARWSKRFMGYANNVADSLVSVAVTGGIMMRSGGQYAREKLAPRETPVAVHPSVKKAADKAEWAARTTMEVTRYTVMQVRNLAEAAAHKAAPYVGRVFGTHKGEPSERQRKILRVAKSGVAGLGVMLDGLETAGRTLASELAKETTETVRHKYGHEVAQLVGTSMQTVGHAANVYATTRALNYRAVARYTASKSVVHAISTAELPASEGQVQALAAQVSITAQAANSQPLAITAEAAESISPSQGSAGDSQAS